MTYIQNKNQSIETDSDMPDIGISKPKRQFKCIKELLGKQNEDNEYKYKKFQKIYGH